MVVYFILAVILVSLFIFPLTKVSAECDIRWDKTWGGTEGDRARSLVVTSDGGYALAGYTYSFGEGDADAWLVKTDASGNMMWNQTYGGTNSDAAVSVVVTSDGGYALAGQTYSFGAGDADFWLVKTDSSGNMMWNQTYGGTNYESAYSLVATSDGGYALAGSISISDDNVDFGLVKTDASGNMVWQKTYGVGIEDVAFSVIQTGDGGYVLAGFTGDPSAGVVCDAWLVKTDANGNMEWNQTYGGTGKDGAYCVVQTGDGGYALAAETSEIGTENYDFWLIKTKAEDTTEPPPTGALPMEYVYVAVAAVVIAVVAIGIIAYKKRK
jgi:hypothetical protein